MKVNRVNQGRETSAVPLSREEVARAFADARLWSGAWDAMGEAERDTFRQGAEGVVALLARQRGQQAQPPVPDVERVREALAIMRKLVDWHDLYAEKNPEFVANENYTPMMFIVHDGDDRREWRVTVEDIETLRQVTFGAR